MRWLECITDSTDMSLSKLWEIVKDRGTWQAAVRASQRIGHNRTTTKIPEVGKLNGWILSIPIKLLNDDRQFA